MSKRNKEFTVSDAELLDELGVEAETEEQRTYTPREERILAGFEDIQRWVQEHDRLPEHGDDRDIFERLYAVRLGRILEQSECLDFLMPLDEDAILKRAQDHRVEIQSRDLNDDELLEALGVDDVGPGDLKKLKHVRTQKEIKAAEEVARRQLCEDFDQFKPVFDAVQQDIDAGKRRIVKFEQHAEINRGDLFIVAGQKALVVELETEFVTAYDRTNRRLRVIFDNGTENHPLLRSFQRALWKNPNSRRILESDDNAPPLFSSEPQEGDVETGHIYVVRSQSNNPFIAENRELIHKIGMTKGDIKQRLSGAAKDPTYLLADVKLVASYQLSNIHPKKLEHLLHVFFADAKLDVTLKDRFGGAVEPREWFMLPLAAIQQAIELLMSGDIEHCRYNATDVLIIDTRTGEPVITDPADLDNEEEDQWLV